MEAESGLNPYAKNPNSSAFGLCQMLYSTRRRLEKKWNKDIDWNDPTQQAEACERLLREEGQSHWDASKKVWKKKLLTQETKKPPKKAPLTTVKSLRTNNIVRVLS